MGSLPKERRNCRLSGEATLKQDDLIVLRFNKHYKFIGRVLKAPRNDRVFALFKHKHAGFKSLCGWVSAERVELIPPLIALASLDDL